MTHQRKVILDVVKKTPGHLSADDVYILVRRVLPNISLATVYRNLDVLSQTGKIARLDNAGNQKRYDSNPVEHCHIRCLSCGKVADVPDVVVDMSHFKHNGIAGFENVTISVSFTGICDECRAAGKDELAG